MKKYYVLLLALVFVLSLFGCKDLARMKTQFIQSGQYLGLGAYVDKIIYMAIDDPDEENWLFFDKWNPIDGDHIIYYMSRKDESLAGLKYVKRNGRQVPISWDSESGLMIARNPFSYNYEEIPGRQWKKEVKEIIVILLKEPKGILEAQMLLAQDLGLIGDQI